MNLTLHTPDKKSPPRIFLPLQSPHPEISFHSHSSKGGRNISLGPAAHATAKEHLQRSTRPLIVLGRSLELYDTLIRVPVVYDDRGLAFASTQTPRA